MSLALDPGRTSLLKRGPKAIRRIEETSLESASKKDQNFLSDIQNENTKVDMCTRAIRSEINTMRRPSSTNLVVRLLPWRAQKLSMFGGSSLAMQFNSPMPAQPILKRCSEMKPPRDQSLGG